MDIVQIKPDWFRLDSDSEEGRLTWFGRSAKEVEHKFKAWLRQQDVRRHCRQPDTFEDITDE